MFNFAVLTNPRSRYVYDTLGVKGLEVQVRHLRFLYLVLYVDFVELGMDNHLYLLQRFNGNTFIFYYCEYLGLGACTVWSMENERRYNIGIRAFKAATGR